MDFNELNILQIAAEKKQHDELISVIRQEVQNIIKDVKIQAPPVSVDPKDIADNINRHISKLPSFDEGKIANIVRQELANSRKQVQSENTKTENIFYVCLIVAFISVITSASLSILLYCKAAPERDTKQILRMISDERGVSLFPNSQQYNQFKREEYVRKTTQSQR